MATTAENQFEIERRQILFKPTTSLPGGGTITWDADPNTVVDGNSDGETLIYNCPLGSTYMQSDGSHWRKTSTPNTWTQGGGGSGHTIQDETTPLTARASINFTGDAVVASDNASTNATDVTINHQDISDIHKQPNFITASARDTYYVLNPSELVDELLVTINNSTVRSLWQYKASTLEWIPCNIETLPASAISFPNTLGLYDPATTDVDAALEEVKLKADYTPKLTYLTRLKDNINLNECHDVQIQDGYAFAVGKKRTSSPFPDTAPWAMIDLNNPSGPTVTDTINTFKNAQTTMPLGNYCLVGDDNGLCLLDISDPANVVFAINGSQTDSTLTDTYLGNINGWKVWGDYLLIACKGVEGGFSVGYVYAVDISTPVISGDSDTLGLSIFTSRSISGDLINFSPHDIDISKDFMLLCSNRVDLGASDTGAQIATYRIIDSITGKLTDGSKWTLLDSLTDYTNLHGSNRCRIIGGYGYTCGRKSTLSAIDLRDPSNLLNPSNIAPDTVDDFTAGLCPCGNYIYTAQNSTIQVYDITDPEAPALVDSITDTATYHDEQPVWGLDWASAHDLEMWGDILVVSADFSNSLVFYRVNGLNAGSANIGSARVGELHVQNRTSSKIIEATDSLILNGKPLSHPDSAPREVYVDKTGADTEGNGFATGTSATLTIQRAVDIISSDNSESVTLAIGAGTYQESVVVSGKKFATGKTLTISGAVTTEVAEFATDTTANTNPMQIWNSTGGSWVNDAYNGYILRCTSGASAGEYAIIVDTVNSDVGYVEIAGTFSATPQAGDTFVIESWLTIIDAQSTRDHCLKIDEGQDTVIVDRILVQDSTNVSSESGGIVITNGSSASIYGCKAVGCAGGKGVSVTNTSRGYVEAQSAHNAGVLSAGGSVENVRPYCTEDDSTVRYFNRVANSGLMTIRFGIYVDGTSNANGGIGCLCGDNSTIKFVGGGTAERVFKNLTDGVSVNATTGDFSVLTGITTSDSTFTSCTNDIVDAVTVPHDLIITRDLTVQGDSAVIGAHSATGGYTGALTGNADSADSATTVTVSDVGFSGTHDLVFTIDSLNLRTDSSNSLQWDNGTGVKKLSVANVDVAGLLEFFQLSDGIDTFTGSIDDLNIVTAGSTSNADSLHTHDSKADIALQGSVVATSTAANTFQWTSSDSWQEINTANNEAVSPGTVTPWSAAVVSTGVTFSTSTGRYSVPDGNWIVRAVFSVSVGANVGSIGARILVNGVAPVQCRYWVPAVASGYAQVIVEYETGALTSGTNTIGIQVIDTGGSGDTLTIQYQSMRFSVTEKID